MWQLYLLFIQTLFQNQSDPKTSVSNEHTVHRQVPLGFCFPSMLFCGDDWELLNVGSTCFVTMLIHLNTQQIGDTLIILLNKAISSFKLGSYTELISMHSTDNYYTIMPRIHQLNILYNG